MKKFITALFILFALHSNGQQTILKGAAGIEFGSTREVVANAMRTLHKDARFTETRENSAFYVGGKWAGRDVLIWAFTFTTTGKLHTIAIIMNPAHQSEVFTLYDDVVADLSDKYGDPKEEDVYETWKYPYASSDKYTLGVTAIKTGNCSICTFYWFPGSDGSMGDNKNSIYVKITDNVNVMVKYQDGILSNDLVKQREVKKQKDM